MKAKLLFSFVVVCTLIACKKDALPEVAVQKNHFNHLVFQDHKLPPRATFFGFEKSTISSKNQSARFLDLNGQWDFIWVKDPKDRPTTFHHMDYNSKDWTTIAVPANWEVEGFGRPIYLDERYPFS